MNEIGNLLRETRENAGVDLEEAASDINIKPLILENIESGNIGCFKDIFALKDNISTYAKYLGLDADKIIDDFNNYLFEYTSKIPVETIEKAIEEKSKEDKKKEQIVSPYTKNKKKKWLVVLYVVIAILVLMVVVWSIKKITSNHSTTNHINYVER